MQANGLIGRIVEEQRALQGRRSLLVAVSGIDASGKGYFAERLCEALRDIGLRTVVLGLDAWLRLPGDLFSPHRPGEHFYENAVRFDEMFDSLVLPLRRNRSVRVEADYALEDQPEYRRHTYEFDDVDVVVLEGIFLFQPAYRQHYDLSVWIDCSFETALERAVERAQEGLPPQETVQAYRTIYFPAQEIHHERDKPHASADVIINNDPRLGAVTWQD